ncbi:hypothetical protein QFW77_18210 [Luteimonas sp. RD2P54]|uniref:Sel1 repeat family protein n=1 Tax=Luteimonas endophytica TaxID=3042023 RepID=A0ABT6JDK6_9GAMM|nr:hypothetical protein [Luteimonas endophytica]MDH5824904.1 hypothetical protein [Luteimonas endophytica]
MSASKPLIALAVLALLAGLALWLRAGSDPRPGEAPAGAQPEAGAVPQATGFAGSAPALSPPPATAATVAQARRESLRASFERADDLHLYLQSLLPAARAGDAEAMWLVSRIHEYCAPYAGDPGGYANDTDLFGRMRLRASDTMVAARERVSRRCGRFGPRDGLEPTMILVQRREAAEAGSLAAEAALLAAGEPLDEAPAYRRDLAARVQRSADPEAYVALAPAMGVLASGDAAYDGMVAGDQFAELAWQLAACELGQDCGAGGALMTNYCANGGVCPQDPAEDFETFVYEGAIPRQGAEVVDAMVDSLLTGEGEMLK